MSAPGVRDVTGRAGLSLARDPVLVALALAGLVCIACYLTGLGGLRFQIRLLWPLQVAWDVLFSALVWRVARLPALAPPARRFWYVLFATSLCLTTGDLSQSIVTAPHPKLSHVDGGTAQVGMLALGITLIVVSMLVYPNPRQTPGERVRFWLDSMTVLVAGAVLAWCFAVQPATTNGTNPVATTVAVGVVLVAAFASVKMILSGNAPMTNRAAAPMIIASFVAGLGSFVPATSPNGNLTFGVLVLRLLPSLLLPFGPRICELMTRADPTALVPRQRRPYSLLPYCAVALTFIVLLAMLPRSLGARLWGIVAGAVLITAMVLARQVLTFRDNFSLIERLDSTLLELRSHEERLRYQASHDGLTGLYNRSAFVEQVTRTLDAEGDRTRRTLLLIDLDDFKAVNDTLGHAIGDALLVTVAQRLRGAVRPEDLVARLGGDEFAILLLDVSEDETAVLATRLLEDLGHPAIVDNHALLPRASVGIAPGDSGRDVDELMRNADIAMYEAKASGKSTFQRYEAAMGTRIVEAASLGTRLRAAIATEQFHLVYQPIVRLADGSTVGCEALVRWSPPGLKPVPPSEFIPIAESTGLIVPLGEWVLGEACRQAAAWHREYPAAANAVMSVNVAGRQLMEPGFVDTVAGVLRKTELPPSLLTIEATETAVLLGGESMDTLHRLRELGVGLALDDFGTAASSLGLLLTCPVSSLKLDRSFVDGLPEATRPSAVATAVIQIARALRLAAVAEGIETREQADYLHGLGYQLAQGFLFSRPLPAEEFTRIWAEAQSPAATR